MSDLTAAQLYCVLTNEDIEPAQARRIVNAATASGAVADDHPPVVWSNRNMVSDHLRDQHGIPDVWIPLDLAEARDRHDAEHASWVNHRHPDSVTDDEIVLCIQPRTIGAKEALSRVKSLQGDEFLANVAAWLARVSGRDDDEWWVGEWTGARGDAS